MADYYSIIARAVRALDPNTGETRRRLYDRARGALLAEMSSAALALDPSDILAAQVSLEEAVGQVETEAQRDERAQRAAVTLPMASPRAPHLALPLPTALPLAPPAASPLDDIVEAPGPPANQNGAQRRGSLRRLWTQVYRRTQVFRRNGHGAHREEPRESGETLFSHFPDPAQSGNGRDTWLTDLLARASREEDEVDEQAFAPPRKIGRSG
jgi:hypothetical protein